MNLNELCKKVTLSQCELIKHTIGLTKDKIKRNKFIEWRNYFTTGTEDEELEQLVNMGVMNKFDKRDTWHNCIIYCLSDLGFELVEYVERIKIVRETK